MTGLNLHQLVRGAITTVHPDEKVTLYQSLGQENNYGVVTARYSEPLSVEAQVQNANSADLALVEKISQSINVMRFYLYADEALPPAGLVRPFARSGDMILRDDDTWWLVTATQDAFSRVGWVCVLATLQELPPEGIELPGTGGGDGHGDSAP